MIEVVKIVELNQTSEVTNEALDTVIKRDTVEDGYREFVMSEWKGIEQPLEASVLEQLQEKLPNVEKLTVSEMKHLDSSVSEQFTEFAAVVIEQHQSPLKVLDFNNLNA